MEKRNKSEMFEIKKGKKARIIRYGTTFHIVIESNEEKKMIWMIDTFRSIFIKLLKIWLHTKESSLVHFIKDSHFKIQ